MSQQPIGMLDSGVGGLSVLREVHQLLPVEHVIYVADQGHLPYGPRPREELRGFVEGIARYLLERGCKLLVIPCNAANAAALHYLRGLFPTWPIVGMEPAIKPAAEHTRTGVIGVITTKATFQGELFASVIDRFAQNVQVETQVCPDFVTVVEQGLPNPDETRQIVATYLAPLQAANIDELVLGCTHFPFLTPYLQDFLGASVEIIDPAPAVARQVKRVLAERGLLNQSNERGGTEYLTSADPAHMQFLVKYLIGETAVVNRGQWLDGRLMTP
ncbi:MAG: glutamate racemase [Anaerolineae bacterium]|nr:glutamate racemase [Anaerolineae bacterium]